MWGSREHHVNKTKQSRAPTPSWLCPQQLQRTQTIQYTRTGAWKNRAKISEGSLGECNITPLDYFLVIRGQCRGHFEISSKILVQGHSLLLYLCLRSRHVLELADWDPRSTLQYICYILYIIPLFTILTQSQVFKKERKGHEISLKKNLLSFQYIISF